MKIIIALAATCFCLRSQGHSLDSKIIEVSLQGGGDTLDYQINLETGIARLAVPCHATVACSIASGGWTQHSGEATKFRESHGLSYFSRIAVSDDGTKYLAADGEPGSKKVRSIQVRSLPSNAVIANAETARRVADLDWIWTDGDFVVLTEIYKISMNPRYWLYAISGHPVQCDSFFLELYGWNGALLKQISIRDGLMNGGGSIVRRSM